MISFFWGEKVSLSLRERFRGAHDTNTGCFKRERGRLFVRLILENHVLRFFYIYIILEGGNLACLLDD